MDKSWSLGIVIGATVAGGFARSIGSARTQFNTLGASIKDLSGQRGLIERFEKDQAELEKTRLKLGSTQKQVLQLKAVLRKDPADAGAAKALALTQTKAVKLGATLDRQRNQLRQSEAAMRKAGIEVQDYAHEYTRLGRALDQARAKHARLQQAMQRKDASAKRLGEMRGQALGMAGLAYGAGRLIGEAGDFGRAGTRLSTVMNTTNLEKDLAASRRHALDFTRRNLGTETEVINIEYALDSAGLDAATARFGSEVVSKVSTVTEGAAEQVGEVIATTFNNLGDKLQGNAEQKLTRIGELLTKTQFKFQIRDFGQLGESMKMATPALAQFNVDLEQGVTLVGALNSAGLQGSMGGTALAATFRNLSKASKEFGFDLARNKTGGIDFIATMQNLSDSIGGFDSLDQETSDRLQKVFGEEGIRMVSLLGPKLKELSAAQRDVAESSKGIVDASYRRFLEDSKGQTQLFTNNVRVLGLTFANTLLPAVNAVLKPATGVARWAGTMIERFPWIGRLIGGVAVGLGTFAAGVGIVTAATWAWNAALLANPIGLVVAGVVGAVAMLITFWEPITDFFKGLWEGIKEIFSKGVDFLTKIWEASPIGMLFKAGQQIGKWVGEFWDGGKKAAGGAAVGVALATNVAAMPQPTLPQASATTTVHAPIQIHASPGMSPEDVANAVDKKLRERESLAMARRRGYLHD